MVGSPGRAICSVVTLSLREKCQRIIMFTEKNTWTNVPGSYIVKE